MHHQITSLRRARAFSMSVLLTGLAIHSILNNWWPSIMITIGAAVAIRQLFLGKYYEAVLSLIIFFGVFFSYHLQIGWKVVWPVIFFTSALFVLVREYFDSKLEPPDQLEEDLNHEIEESKEDK